MTTKQVVIPIAALLIGVGSSSMAVAQSGERHHNESNHGSERSRGESSARQDNGNRGGDHSRGEQRAQQPASGQSQSHERQQTQSQPQQQAPPPQAQQRTDRSNRDGGSVSRNGQSANESARRDDRGGRDGRYDNNHAVPRGSYDRDRRDYNGYNGRSYDRNDHRGSFNSDWYRGNWSRGYNGYSRGYYAPRLLPRVYSPRHYYGSGGRLSLYFGLGSGYLYGSPFSGRVYGYRSAIPTYGSYVSYGDIRIKDAPRDAEVYVDGYYAGVVDDFDGFLQRLTLEVGPHQIEVAPHGGESQFFDVYVDPYNTVDLHADFRR